MVSNAADRSASTIHTRLLAPLSVVNSEAIASAQPRPGRNPYDLGSNRASHSGSSALRTRAWWHRSVITGMPSGRRFPLAFGTYARRTGSGFQVEIDWCTRTAISARSVGDSASCPSMPAVRRPALRCVTWRTLSSVFDQERSIIFCSDRT